MHFHFPPECNLFLFADGCWVRGDDSESHDVGNLGGVVGFLGDSEFLHGRLELTNGGHLL